MKKWRSIISGFVLMALLSSCATMEQGNEQSNNKTKGNISTEQTTSMNTPTKNIRDERFGIQPVTLEIPSIGVKAKIENVGLLDNGQMDVPDGSENVAWYEPGTKPGEAGNAVIAGHVDDLINPAVFFNLHNLKKDDEIFVTDKDGQKITFKVIDKKVFPREDAPIDEIFGFTYRSMLNLITCVGAYDSKTTERAERLVIFTELVEN